jgi:dTDP-4-amino-4,6-dideoxygalactose transaminase
VIPFLDLKTQYLGIKDEVLGAIERVLDSTQFVLGSEVAAFEQEFAAYSGAAHGVGMNSGTSALHLALLAAGVGPGDEVITVPHTFVATVAAIRYAGATTVFVDIDPESYTMDPAQLETAITERTKAIIPVHLYGQPADMDPILEVARRHGVVVIEDAAQAHGAEYRGRRCGGMGHMGCFSFYPGKNLGAYGEGGMVVTSDDELLRKLRMLRDWGQEKKYHHEILGYNARLEGVQGAVLRVKLPYLEGWTEARRQRAADYRELLDGCGAVVLPRDYEDRRHVYHIFAVRTPDRPGFMQFLQERGVQSAIHYPFAVHTLPGYADLGYRAGQFPHAERAAAEVVSLPMFPELSRDQVATVAGVVKEWAAR